MLNSQKFLVRLMYAFAIMSDHTHDIRSRQRLIKQGQANVHLLWHHEHKTLKHFFPLHRDISLLLNVTPSTVNIKTLYFLSISIMLHVSTILTDHHRQILTYSVKQCCSWEANRLAASLEFSPHFMEHECSLSHLHVSLSDEFVIYLHNIKDHTLYDTQFTPR
jgi:hypothetical protein